MDKLYPWLDESHQRLIEILKNTNHHAFLITAPKGMGKINLVENTIKTYLCENSERSNRACNTCKACLLVESGNHPDIFIVDDLEEDKKSAYIKIARIRALTKSLSNTAQIAKTKTVILNPADKLNTGAANSFLKTLEEPPGDCQLFLITDKPFALPATILSRCLKVNLNDISDEKVLNYLKTHVKNTTNIELAYQLNNKSPLQTLNFIETGLDEKRLECFKLFKGICNKKESLGSIGTWINKQKIELDEVLNWLNSWVSDLCKLSLNINNKQNLENPDFIDELITINNNKNLTNLFKHQKRLTKIANMDKTSLNKKVLITDLLANIVMC